MKRIITFSIALVLALVVAANSDPARAKPVKGAEIDWARGVYTATAQQSMGHTSKLVASAKSTAVKTAINEILSAVAHTAVDSFSLGKELLARPEVRRLVAAVINRYAVANQSVISINGVPVVEVSIRVPVFRIFQALRPFAGEEVKMRMLPKGARATHVEIKRDRLLSVSKDTQVGPFTSVIVDTSGLKVERAMSPKIRKADGSEVWGTVKADYDFIEDHGIVAYVHSMAKARKNERAGSNPLIVTAIGRAGGKFYCDAVISDSDAKLLLDENGKSHFLDKFKVIFVVDGNI